MYVKGHSKIYELRSFTAPRLHMRF